MAENGFGLEMDDQNQVEVSDEETAIGEQRDRRRSSNLRKTKLVSMKHLPLP